MEKPTCSEETALKQAGMTVRGYLCEAVEMLDNQFGSGFARNNTGLVGDLIKAQAMDFNCTASTAALYEIAKEIDTNNFDLAKAIESSFKSLVIAKLDIHEDQKASSNPIANAIHELSNQIKN